MGNTLKDNFNKNRVMNIQKNKGAKALVSKEIKENKVWDEDKMNRLNRFILTESEKQSPERKLRNELLSIKYQMQDDIEKDHNLYSTL